VRHFCGHLLHALLFALKKKTERKISATGPRLDQVSEIRTFFSVLSSCGVTWDQMFHFFNLCLSIRVKRTFSSIITGEEKSFSPHTNDRDCTCSNALHKSIDTFSLAARANLAGRKLVPEACPIDCSVPFRTHST
jgi:hypothetical protein